MVYFWGGDFFFEMVEYIVLMRLLGSQNSVTCAVNCNMVDSVRDNVRDKFAVGETSLVDKGNSENVQLSGESKAEKILFPSDELNRAQQQNAGDCANRGCIALSEQQANW